jgi:hypothetical protein
MKMVVGCPAAEKPAIGFDAAGVPVELRVSEPMWWTRVQTHVMMLA